MAKHWLLNVLIFLCFYSQYGYFRAPILILIALEFSSGGCFLWCRTDRLCSFWFPKGTQKNFLPALLSCALDAEISKPPSPLRLADICPMCGSNELQTGFGTAFSGATIGVLTFAVLRDWSGNLMTHSRRRQWC